MGPTPLLLFLSMARRISLISIVITVFFFDIIYLIISIFFFLAFCVGKRSLVCVIKGIRPNLCPLKMCPTTYHSPSPPIMGGADREWGRDSMVLLPYFLYAIPFKFFILLSSDEPFPKLFRAKY